MELFVVLALILVGLVVFTYVGAAFIVIGVVALVLGAAPGWVLVAGVALLFLWPETYEERRGRAQRIQTDEIITNDEGAL